MSNAGLDFDTKWNTEFAADLVRVIQAGNCTPDAAWGAVEGMYFSPQQWEAIPAGFRTIIERFTGRTFAVAA